MHAARVQLIRISEDRVVLKQGVHELLVEGPGGALVAERLLMLADGTRSEQEIVAAFPGPERPAVEQLLKDLLRRNLLSSADADRVSASAESEQAAFYSNFGRHAAETPARLAAAKVLMIGVNRTAIAVVQSLLDLGLGKITVAEHLILNNRHVSLAEFANHDRVRCVTEVPQEDAWAGYSLVCAASDLGEANALLDLSRIALATRRPYLPMWFCDLIGFVGPLNIPFETPCFNCFRLRRDSNDARYDVSRAVRGQFAIGAANHSGTGLLPPMARVLGDVASLEIVKHLGGFAPADSLSRVIEMNLVSFHTAVRRILKVPRCPECSDLTFRSAKAITTGPHIPPEGGGVSRV